MVFIPEFCDCVWCCLKCCISHQYLILISVLVICVTPTNPDQPNHTGSIWLRREARIPGESAPRPAPTCVRFMDCVLRGRPLHSLWSSQMMRGHLGRESEGEVDEDGGKGERGTENGSQFESMARAARTSSEVQVWIIYWMRRVLGPAAFSVSVT